MEKPQDKPLVHASQKRYTESEKREIFQYWYDNNQEVSCVVRKFGCCRDTVYRLIKRGKWKKRAKDISADVAKSIDRKIARQELSTVQVALKMLKRESEAYLKEGRAYEGNPKIIIAICQYLDSVQGNMPKDEGQGDNIVNLTNIDSAELERVLGNALAGLAGGITNDRGPFSSLPSGCVRSSK